MSILQHRVRLAPALLRDFAGVDDTYLAERLYAAVYGAAMRSSDRGAVAGAAQVVYQLVFAAGTPPANVLLPDQTRGVIESARQIGCPVDFGPSLIRPPYRSLRATRYAR